MRPETPDHHCPGCGTPQRAFERYPWHFCNDCLALAEDGAGNRLRFGNASASGGLVWQRAGDVDWTVALTIYCRIKTRPVIVREARFGGVVAEPLHDAGHRDEKRVTDLRRA